MNEVILEGRGEGWKLVISKLKSMDDDDDDETTLFNNCNWSELHEDILELILKKLSTVADCLRFGCVCVSWRSLLVLHLHPDLHNPQFPLLMIPSLPWPKYPAPPPPPPLLVPIPSNKLQEYKNKKLVEKRSFYNVFEKRVYEDFHIQLPYNMNCRGSSHGWIIASGNVHNDYCVELFNPFISINNEYQKIQLPPLTAFPYDPDIYLGDGDHFLEKAILSANPTITTEYVVMVIYSGLGKLGYWKPGDQVWTDVPLPLPLPLNRKEYSYDPLDDVIYDHNNGLFYLVNVLGEVMICDLNCGDGNADDVHKTAKVKRLAPPQMVAPRGGHKKYIVKSEGDLLVVHKFGVSDGSITRFLCFKFREEKIMEDGDKENPLKDFCVPEWEYMSTLPGRMLFLGDNASMSLAASEFPGGKSSCIYFTDDGLANRLEGYLQMGIFNGEDISIEKLHPMGSNKYMSPANTIWVEPTLKCRLHF